MNQKIGFLAQFQVFLNDKIKMADALRCITSLVKISNEFDHISVGCVQKTAQKRPKIVLFAGTKTFEISELENYK